MSDYNKKSGRGRHGDNNICLGNVEEKDLVYAYYLINKKYITHGEPVEVRTFNGETKSVVNKDGEDIIVF